MAKGTHEYRDDPRNEDILIYVNGELVPRDRGHRSPCSTAASSWETGSGRACGCTGAGSCPWVTIWSDFTPARRPWISTLACRREALTEALYRTVEANGMRDHVHIRLMVSSRPQVDAVPGSPGDRRARPPW